MNFDRINEQLQKIKTTKKIEDIHTLIGFLTEPLGVRECEFQRLFMHASVQREVSRFMSAQGFRNQAAAYTIPHQSGIPLDIKLFWMKKTTKANLSWVMALTPNYEDNPETNANLNIGIDIVVSENCDSVFIVLSNNLKVRVLELNGLLSLTQQEIFDNWTKIGKTINRESENFKSELHKLLWKSFDFEPINRKFYLQLVEQFDHLVGHLKNKIDEESAKMFAVRLIGRTLFLWFLRKKQFINSEKEYFTVTGDADQTDYYREKLEPLFFDVLNTEMKSRDYDDVITPFLNGGLFEPIETDFYKKSELTFPIGFFTQFFGILNHYNFTVDEGTSEYEQVAVDPEMLGRVFENLLASLNDETGNQARKSKGAFYTPREIVDYMCEQSLIEYLKIKLPDTTNRDRRIEELVTMDEATFREQDHNKRRDWKKDLGQEQVTKALDELRILDPAVGSGAFPMGMLNLLVKVYTRIDTALEKDLAQLKRDILSRSLYGVDIDQMAIQISRLRAWLSILVDMENLKKVDPLPNLDFKFVCANTLIPLDEGSNGLFDADVNLKEKLIALRDQYYAATRKTDKEKIRKEYLKLIQTGDLFASERELQLKNYNPFNPLNSSGFYDPTLMHGVDAFDVVIGNPPYVNIFNISDTNYRSFLKNNYAIYKNKTDLYAFFIEKGHQLIRNNGILYFIISNSWLGTESFINLRKFILENAEVIGFIKCYADVFDASVNTVILGIKKNKVLDQNIPLMQFDGKFKSLGRNLSYNEIREQATFGFSFDIPVPIKIPNISLGKICEFSLGIKTSDDKRFITETQKDSDHFPLLRGKDVASYKTNFTNKYIWYKPELMMEKKGAGPRKKEVFQLPEKILVKDIASEISATIDTEGYFVTDTLSIIYAIKKPYSINFILGLLNSKFIRTWFNSSFPAGLHIKINQLKQIPIPQLSGDSEVVFRSIEENVSLVLNKKKVDQNTSDLESQIDELVMDLYGLNEEEKEVIRNS